MSLKAYKNRRDNSLVVLRHVWLFLLSYSALVLAVQHSQLWQEKKGFRLRSVQGAATLIYLKLQLAPRIKKTNCR